MRPAPPAPLAVVLALVLACPALAQPAGPTGHRLFLSPTARPVAGTTVGVTAGTVPTAALALGRGVSLGLGVSALPAGGGWGVVVVEPKWTVVDRERLAVAVGLTAVADPVRTSGVQALPFAVATATGGAASVTVGVGGRVDAGARDAGAGLWRALGCRSCEGDAYDRGRGLRVVPAPSAALGAELRVSDGVTLVAEGTALVFLRDVPVTQPLGAGGGAGGAVASDPWFHYSVGAGARVRSGRAAFDVGVLAVSDGSERPRYVGVAPWVGVGVGL